MKIVYKNKLEVKILVIVCGLVFGSLYLFCTITDLSVRNPHFWHNQLCLLQIALLFSIPIVIIARHRIVFDFDKRTVTRRGYLTPERTYDFSELDVDYVLVSPVVSRFIFSTGGRIVFKLEEFDFQKQTGESSDWLKELFRGEALEIFHIEKRLNSLEIIAHATTYSFSDELRIYISNRHYGYGARVITAEYLSSEDSFILCFEEMDFSPENDNGMKTLKEVKLPRDAEFENKLAELSSWVLEVEDE